MRVLELRCNSADLKSNAVAHKAAPQQQQKTWQWLAAGLATTSTILVAIGMVSYRSLNQLFTTSNAASRSYQVLEKLETVLSLMKDVETGQRGYVILGKESYLEPHQAATKLIDREVKELRKLMAVNPSYQQLNTLEALVAAKLAVSKQIIDLRRQKDFANAQSLMLTGKGKNLMDRIRFTVNQMEEQENQLLTQRALAAAASAENLVFNFCSGLVLTFFILVGVYYYFYWEIWQRKQIQTTLQQERDFTAAVLNTIGALVVVLDPLGRIVGFNQACQQTTGYLGAEVTGKYF